MGIKTVDQNNTVLLDAVGSARQVVIIRPTRTVLHDTAFVEIKLINEAPIRVQADVGEPDGLRLPLVCVSGV